MPYVNSSVCHAQKSKTTHSRKNKVRFPTFKGFAQLAIRATVVHTRYTGDPTNTCRRRKKPAVKSGAHDIGFRT